MLLTIINLLNFLFLCHITALSTIIHRFGIRQIEHFQFPVNHTVIGWITGFTCHNNDRVWTNEFADFNSFPMQKHLGKISACLNEMSGVTMKLGLDENGELKVMPDFHSVFDAARFALSQYVYLSLRIIRLLMQTGLVLPPVSAVAAYSSRTETVRNTVTIQNVKRNETAENPAQLITGKYRKKMITAGRNHGCFHTGARCGK